MSNHAESRIEFICNWAEDPEGFCKEDWKSWRPLIAIACAQVTKKR